MEPVPPAMPHISVEQFGDPRSTQMDECEPHPQQMLLHNNNSNNNHNDQSSQHTSRRSSAVVAEADDVECIVYLSGDDENGPASHEPGMSTEQGSEETTTEKLEQRFEELNSIWSSVKLRSPSPEALRRHTYTSYTGKLGSPERNESFTPLYVPRSMWRSPVKTSAESRSPVKKSFRSGSTDGIRGMSSSFQNSKRTPSTTPMQRNAVQRKSLGSSNIGDKGEQRVVSRLAPNAEIFPNPPPSNFVADTDKDKASHSATSIPMVRLSNARVRNDTSADHSGSSRSGSKIMDSPSRRRASSLSDSNRLAQAKSSASFCSAAVVGSPGKNSNNIGSNRQPSATRQQTLRAAIGTTSPSRTDANGAATRSPNRMNWNVGSRKTSQQTTPTRVGTTSPRSSSVISPRRTTITYKQCPSCGYLKVRFDANFCQACGVRCTGIA